MTINKKEFADRFAEKMNITKKDANELTDGIIETITDILADGEDIKITGFGTLGVKVVPPRTARNPQTGEEIVVEAKKRVYFKAGKTLKDSI